MFESARLKLTAWYLLIIMLISMLFSVAIYDIATREIHSIINRIQYEQYREQNNGFSGRQGRSIPFTIKELQAVKDRIKLQLFFINAVIFFTAGGAGYFLAGRTLRPIKAMIDEQNQFISSASHELRTPIATMRAEMEGSLLEKNIADKDARKLITSNLEELGELQNLTNNLLQLAQVHNVKAEKFQEDVSITECVASALKKVKSLAKRKNITIDKEITDAIVTGDRNSMKEVFVILLDNAIKYSPPQSEIHITSEMAKNVVTINVIDNGIGIAKKDLLHIFERFYRADKSRNEEGYGLGLSIARKMVETHNGSITVQSKINKPARNALHSNAGGGTTFSVTLPLKTS
ncbi:MAG: HAMP domain-containing histidine kinase [Candidatus Levybacteria bacterium]|nr:HAMP domain-containing histidine kinase [Candidatus Levybacteria bacterium]